MFKYIIASWEHAAAIHLENTHPFRLAARRMPLESASRLVFPQQSLPPQAFAAEKFGLQLRINNFI